MGRAGASDDAGVGGTVLVIDGESTLGQGLVRLLRESGRRVSATCPGPEKADSGSDPSGVLRVPWGRASTVSARNVLLRTVTAFGRLDAAVFTFDPALERVLLHEADYADIEGAVDEWVRGTLFLLREVLGLFVRQGSGTLALVRGFARGRPEESPPLEAMVRGAVGELASSLLSSYEGTGVTVVSFETSSPETDGYLRFVVGKLRAGRGRRRGGRSFRYRRARLGGLLPPGR
jgi:NAD(P)-dependent dehydrogenase (short-subunit alcohol dehydrogenase family)